jgi:hypothetical protein
MGCYEGETLMQKTRETRSTSGAKAIALDERAKMARYRLYLLISLLSSAGLAMLIHILLGR